MPCLYRTTLVTEGGSVDGTVSAAAADTQKESINKQIAVLFMQVPLLTILMSMAFSDNASGTEVLEQKILLVQLVIKEFNQRA